MVLLELKSKIDSKSQPFLNNWDQNQRVSHKEYQNEIDKVTYHLQRSQRGLLFLGQWAYPRFFQKDILTLEVLQKKQWLGKINQEEVEQFKRFNPEIASDLNKTFSTNLFNFPTKGLFAGLGLFAFGSVFNYRYSYRLAFLLLPMCADFSLSQFDKSSNFRTMEFLEWAISYRTQRARQEIWAQKNAERVVSPKNLTAPVRDEYQRIIDLIVREAPRE